MKAAIFLAALSSVAAYPSMTEFESELAKRQSGPSNELWGDLESEGAKSPTGEAIMSILTGKSSGLESEGYEAPEMDSKECQEDECCIWKYISEELLDMMSDGNGCNDFARGAIRFGFHDAAAWEKSTGEGGADASLMLSGTELSRGENSGLAATAGKYQSMHSKYSKDWKIGLADLIQCGAKVGVMACRGPRIRMFLGRPDSSKAAPMGLLPPPTFTAKQSMDLFGKKTVSPFGLVALLGAHSCSQSHGSQVLPQDKTPGVWDTEYFSETLKTNQSSGVARFMSDINLAHDAITGPVYEEFSGNAGSWDSAYASEYVRMSLMGVQKMNDLRECSKAMPKGNVKPGDKPKPTTSKSEDKPTSATKPDDYTSTTYPADKETSKAESTDYPDSDDSYPTPAPTKDAQPVAASGAGRMAGSLLAVAAAALALL